MANLVCNCGKVVITTPSLPTMRVECCCVDCRKGLAWCADKGGPQPPPVPDLVYFPNALKVEKGMEHLRCFLIKEGYNTRRVVADCCWTCILGDHPAYEGLHFVSYNKPEIISFKGQDASLRPVDERINKNDMATEELVSLPMEGTPDPSWRTRGVSEAKDALSLLPKDEYLTVQGLIQAVGKVEIMDPNYNGPDTKWNKIHPNGPTI